MVALAEAVGGSETAFAALMNQEAQRLGMRNTHFMNATGLPDPQQVRAHAAVFGLGHGLAISHMTKADKGRRSYGLFFRDDRDFEIAEVETLLRIIQKLHDQGLKIEAQDHPADYV